MFSGAGASHQNGSAERVIKTVVTMESTILIHADLRCTANTFSDDIWPISIDYILWIYNFIPDI